MSEDHRLFAPATARNRDVLLSALQSLLPPAASILETASGSGEHAVHFAKAQPDWTIQPSDIDGDARRSVAAWIAAEGVSNVAAPIVLNAAGDWAEAHARGPFDAVLSVNMIHIAPWSAAEGLARGAAGVLKPGGRLVLYGPFRRDGVDTAPSNEAFDESLRARNPAWGLRRLEDVERLAQRQGFLAAEIQIMPANNLTVAFRLDDGR